MQYEGVRNTIESMYEGVCDVTEHRKTKDPVTKKTIFDEIVVLSRQPCRLSHGSAPVASDGNVAEVVKEIKLFVSPDIDIKEGSKIEVTQAGHTGVYTNAGAAKHYPTHQEIMLKQFERWA